MASVQLLGPLEYQATSGSAVELGQARQRAVFAMLAVNANDVVMVSDLIDWAWETEAPRSARNMIHSYISRLRGALTVPGGPADATVQRRHGGYTLQIDPAAVDLQRFRGAVAAARAGGAGTPPRVRLLREALGAWRGRALGGLTGPWAERTRRLLELERLSVLVECHEGELRLGGAHPALLDELRALAAEHPDNELVVRNLMTGLYRSGWQAEALAAYDTLRHRLADRLGVDPAGQTQELYEAILRADPELAAGAGGQAAGPRGPAAAPRVPRVPRQLPRGSRFVGRDQELAVLDGFMAAAGERPVRVIEGPAGIGKTALAVHWAHRVAHRFPDGQIFVDLHGTGAGGERPSREEVLRYVLWSLGVALPDRQSELPGEVVELYRSTVKGLRLLIVLDDLSCAQQIEAMLPGAAQGSVVVTTRSGSSLAELAGPQRVRYVRLHELTREQSERLLAAILGEGRVAAEPGAVDEIIELCGRTPQALSSAAERALARPRLALADLARSLARTG